MFDRAITLTNLHLYLVKKKLVKFTTLILHPPSQWCMKTKLLQELECVKPSDQQMTLEHILDRQ